MYLPEVVSKCQGGSKHWSPCLRSFLKACCWSGNGLVALVVGAVVAVGDSLPSSSNSEENKQIRWNMHAIVPQI